MRARGAKVTDIVVLVVAADDGVMPQTVEAINHAKAAGVPIIVAINKIDKPGADPQRVRTDLLSHEIVVESLGGDTLEIEVSARRRPGLDKLLEAIRAAGRGARAQGQPDRPAEGVDRRGQARSGRGPVGTVLVQRGTLKLGDHHRRGLGLGPRARADQRPSASRSRKPAPRFRSRCSASTRHPRPATSSPWSRTRPAPARSPTTACASGASAGGRRPRGTLEQMMNQLKEAGTKEFPLVVKGDVQGSVEAIAAALDKLGTDEVRARIIHAGVGGITESDVWLAATSGAVVLGFNVRANAQAREVAERDGVEIRYYAVIYDLVDDVKQAMSGLLAPTLRETFLGNAEILEVFTISKVGKVAGCRVTEGKVERGAQVRLIRDNVVVHEGKLSDAQALQGRGARGVAGQECGMAFEGYQDMRQGDVIECFQVEHVKRTL